MRPRLSETVGEFYEQGLFNILHLIPSGWEDEERLWIESVIFAGFGLFRAYERLEDLLDTKTDDEPRFQQTYHTRLWTRIAA